MPASPVTAQGLYHPQFEHDSCGFGLIANIDGKSSNHLVKSAITALVRLTHRGAIAADGQSGDGCGLLLGKPDTFLRQIASKQGINLGKNYAVGMLFLSQDENLAQAQQTELNQQLNAVGFSTTHWLEAGVNYDACGEEARSSCPRIKRLFVELPDTQATHELEGQLFIARRRTELALASDADFYVASLSVQVIVYKALMMPEKLADFYPELNHPSLTSSMAVFHQRFSTNTLPKWRLAQPFRTLAHNGEINTIQGNRYWAKARLKKFISKQLPELEELEELVGMDGSDSASLDNMLEVLLMGGMDLFRAAKLLLPPAWQNAEYIDPDLHAFYQYQSLHMEPWDGPAGVVFTNGRYAACVMDRNGLRPSRYIITNDRHIILASEVGVYNCDAEDIICKGRLKPGEMLAVDTATGKILFPNDIDKQLKQSQPYAQWLTANMRQLNSSLSADPPSADVMSLDQLAVYEKLFQITFEDRNEVIRTLAQNAQEAIGSMGDDTPFPVLSQNTRSLYDYFRQQFAQVTNPPIDPLRESIVMSLETIFGREHLLFEETADHANVILAKSPVLSESKFHRLCHLNEPDYAPQTLDLNFSPKYNLQQAIDNLCKQATAAVKSGKTLLILSDRNIASNTLPIHAALATGAIHHSLIAAGLRCDANIIVETASTINPHHFAVLISYGATAIYPYLAYAIIDEMSGSTTGSTPRTHPLRISSSISQEGQTATSYSAVLRKNFRRGINKGLLKIISKMGISTLASYRGSQLFEAVGLGSEIIQLCFPGTVSRIEGTQFSDLQSELHSLSNAAWDQQITTNQGGLLKYIHGGEYHAFNPDVVQALQTAANSGSMDDYKIYTELVNQRPITVIRDLFALKANNPVDINLVEPASEIFKRFDSAGMSLGALSPEAHETLASAMNDLGARSNSGEGGEDPKRYNTNKVSKIKQIASGRFGITPDYLMSAEVLQIKMAQGAKPGEGGQLPGHKVNSIIAKLRYSHPGVALISPPPHHDIYSIEDLAQLIFDLKQINPSALVSVKLVAEAGVGTIAAGVVKAYADLITISGYDGGTGASPISSVKYAGSPWELGLAETHQTLCTNNLRHRIRLQTDGGLKTGLDVIKAAILGAESFGFGTTPMIAMGCKYLRICHLNNCATGVATQNLHLREHHFVGNKEKIINFFTLVAEDARLLMASLGVTQLTDLIGRTDLLEVLDGNTSKQQHLNLQPILDASKGQHQYCTTAKNQPYDKAELATKILADCQPALLENITTALHYQINNTDRSIGARISGEIAKRYANQRETDKAINLFFKGTAGQSFGVWNATGLNLYLDGDANDYVAKGMAGGKVVLRPTVSSHYQSQEAVIMGNTCLYGATGGKLFASGCAGERFAVRNSGAIAVLEGVGDHGCEYMTGGAVVILGETGVNFGAGMTGGLAFILDQKNQFVDSFNRELIDIHRINSENMEAYRNFLQLQIEEFVAETQSPWGIKVLKDFYYMKNRFWLVKPKASEMESLLAALYKAA